MVVRFETAVGAATPAGDCVADCVGMGARDPDLRGVRGEMLILHAPDLHLSRPVRMLHPRIPVYIVPRADNLFMVGATMIESADDGPVSVRSTMELLNAAYSLHPAFGEAKIVEMGAGVRPAYIDNLPRVTVKGRKVSINGLYRHGISTIAVFCQHRRRSNSENFVRRNAMKLVVNGEPVEAAGPTPGGSSCGTDIRARISGNGAQQRTCLCRGTVQPANLPRVTG